MNRMVEWQNGRMVKLLPQQSRTGFWLTKEKGWRKRELSVEAGREGVVAGTLSSPRAAGFPMYHLPDATIPTILPFLRTFQLPEWSGKSPNPLLTGNFGIGKNLIDLIFLVLMATGTGWATIIFSWPEASQICPDCRSMLSPKCIPRQATNYLVQSCSSRQPIESKSSNRINPLTQSCRIHPGDMQCWNTSPGSLP